MSEDGRSKRVREDASEGDEEEEDVGPLPAEVTPSKKKKSELVRAYTCSLHTAMHVIFRRWQLWHMNKYTWIICQVLRCMKRATCTEI